MNSRFANIPEYQLQVGNLRMDLVQQRIWYVENELVLQPSIKRALSLFLLNPGRLISNEDIYECITDRNPALVYNNNATKVSMSRLRGFLRSAGCDPEIIKTVRNKGYVLR